MDISQRAGPFFERPVRQLDGPRVEAGPRELDEVFFLTDAVGGKFNARQVNKPFATLLQSFPGAFDAQGNFEFPRKHVHRAQRQHAQARPRETLRGVTDAIEHLIDRAVAARGHHEFEPVGHRLRRQPPGIVRRGRGLQRALRADGVKLSAKVPGFFTAGRRIENDAGAHRPNDFGRTVLVEQKARLLAFTGHFPETDAVSGAKNWKIPKWPFLLGNALLLGFAFYIVWQSPHPISQPETILCLISVAMGVILGVAPFLLDHRAVLRLVEVNALGDVAGKIQDLERLATQINTATGEWVNVQTQAEKISNGAKEIADRMSEEVRQFSDFMQKMNDSEKAGLRLETEKLRRGEAEWLQVLVRILDHVFALHTAAVQSNQPQVAGQITHFQNACRGAARRVGVTPFVAEPDEPFNPERHQVLDAKSKPPADAIVSETVGVGYTFQGRLLRPALVRLKGNGAAKPDEERLPLEATGST